MIKNFMLKYSTYLLLAESEIMQLRRLDLVV